MTTSPGVRPRPLSPFMIWRWHITMATSIAHRATGAALYGAAIILAAWAFALAKGGALYAAFMGVMGSLAGQVVLFAITVAAFYHLGNGVRHLVWDTGRGFAVKTANASAWLVIAFSIVAAVAVWALALTGAI